jgi:hypothetical protein
MKHFLEAGALDNQERHLALKMSALRMAHAKRERGSALVK